MEQNEEMKRKRRTSSTPLAVRNSESATAFQRPAGIVWRSATAANRQADAGGSASRAAQAPSPISPSNLQTSEGGHLASGLHSTAGSDSDAEILPVHLAKLNRTTSFVVVPN